MKMYDVSKDGGSLRLKSTIVPEIEDFKVDETVELHIVAKVKGINKVEQHDMAVGPSNSEAPKKKPKEHTEAELKIVSCGVMNEKADRKEVERTGMSMDKYREIKAKREAKNKA